MIENAMSISLEKLLWRKVNIKSSENRYYVSVKYETHLQKDVLVENGLRIQ